ncbi:MAG: hypothetical protein QHH07_07410 [Sedimentisphaerales bacterium]|jgi:hypothetical protein|nr:hypothetical protein [Sedimentisphaerales bacterium]
MLPGVVLLLALSAIPTGGQTYEVKAELQAGLASHFIRLQARDLPFQKEPDLPAHVLARFILPVADDSRIIGLLADADANALFVDLNADGDLTNDPNSIFTAERPRSPSGPMHIVDLPIPIGQVLGTDPNLIYRFEGWFYVALQNRGHGILLLKSAYIAGVPIKGLPFVLSFIDTNLDGQIDLADKVRITGPSVGGQLSNQGELPIPKQLYIAGSTLELDLDRFPLIELRPAELPTGRLILDANEATLALLFSERERRIAWLDPSEGPFELPAGAYRCLGLAINGPHRPVWASDCSRISVKILQAGQATLSFGAPSITMSR